MNFTSTIDIAAPPAAVWAALTDLDQAPRVVPLLHDVTLLDPVLQEGARVRVTVKAAGSLVPTDAVVSACAIDERLALHADVPSVRTAVDLGWDLAPSPEGTRVVQKIVVNFSSAMAQMAAKAVLGKTLSQETSDEGLRRLKATVEEKQSAGA